MTVRFAADALDTTTYYRASAPLRLGFAGGGTDVPPIPALLQGGRVVNAAIDSRVVVTLIPLPADAPSHQVLTDAGQPMKGPLADLAYAIERRNDDAPLPPFQLRINAPFPSGSGLGQSSAIVVAAIAAFCHWQDRYPLLPDLAERAVLLERADLKIPGGVQDHYAAALGGVLSLHIGPDGAVSHTRLDATKGRDPFLQELSERLVATFTQDRPAALGVAPIEQLVANARARPFDLNKLRQCAIMAEGAFRTRDFYALCHAVRDDMTVKYALAPQTVSPSIMPEYIHRAYRAGALAVKVSGAGGGGVIYAVCPPFGIRERVRDAWDDYSGVHGPRAWFPRLSPAGVRSWKVDGRNGVRP